MSTDTEIAIVRTATIGTRSPNDFVGSYLAIDDDFVIERGQIIGYVAGLALATCN